MTLDDYLEETVTMLEDMGLDVFLYGSTLLHIVRDGKIDIGHKGDKELNIGCLGEDLTDDIVEKIEKKSNWMMCKSTPMHTNHLVYFSRFPDTKKDVWTGCPMFTLLAPYYKNEHERYEYMYDYCVKIFDAKHFDDKKKWDVIQYEGRKYKTLRYHKKWLRDYFGKDWKKPNGTWSWITSAPNKHDLKKKRNFIYYLNHHDTRYD